MSLGIHGSSRGHGVDVGKSVDLGHNTTIGLIFGALGFVVFFFFSFGGFCLIWFLRQGLA